MRTPPPTRNEDPINSFCFGQVLFRPQVFVSNLGSFNPLRVFPRLHRVNSSRVSVSPFCNYRIFVSSTVLIFHAWLWLRFLFVQLHPSGHAKLDVEGVRKLQNSCVFAERLRLGHLLPTIFHPL